MRACVECTHSGFVCFPYLSRSSCSIYIMYMYTTTIGQQKSQNTTALPSPGLSDSVPWYTMKNILYRLCILLSMGSQNWQLWRVFLWCLRIEKLKTNDTCRGERASLLSSLHKPTLYAHVVHVNTWTQRGWQFATTVTVLWPTYIIRYYISKGTRVIVLYYYNDFFCIYFSSIFTQYENNIHKYNIVIYALLESNLLKKYLDSRYSHYIYLSWNALRRKTVNCRRDCTTEHYILYLHIIIIIAYLY